MKINNETLKYIAEVEALTPTGTRSLAEIREDYEKLCAHFRVDSAGLHIQTKDEIIRNIPIRTYTYSPPQPDDTILLYLHGGGFVLGNLETHDDICREICAATKMRTIAADYRLAPEYQHPYPLEDCVTIFQYLREKSQKIIVIGDSAGGWLSAMLAIRFGRLLLGQVLIYPMLGGRMDAGSYISHANAPLLTTDQIIEYWQAYWGQDIELDEELPPMNSHDFRHLPPTVIIGAEYDPLFSDSVCYTEKLRQQGVTVRFITAHALPHGYLRGRHKVKSIEESFAEICCEILSLARCAVNEANRSQHKE